MKKSEKSYKEYVPRDVSWMFFNYRILQEAEKKMFHCSNVWAF